jgi:hypothetical protein
MMIANLLTTTLVQINAPQQLIISLSARPALQIVENDQNSKCYPHGGTINCTVILHTGHFHQRAQSSLKCAKQSKKFQFTCNTLCKTANKLLPTRARRGQKSEYQLDSVQHPKRPGGYDNQIADSRK